MVFLLLYELTQSAIYESQKFDSHKWPTVLVDEVIGTPRNFEWYLCGSLYSTFKISIYLTIMRFITNGFKHFSQTNSSNLRQRVPLKTLCLENIGNKVHPVVSSAIASTIITVNLLYNSQPKFANFWPHFYFIQIPDWLPFFQNGGFWEVKSVHICQQHPICNLGVSSCFKEHVIILFVGTQCIISRCQEGWNSWVAWEYVFLFHRASTHESSCCVMYESSGWSIQVMVALTCL